MTIIRSTILDDRDSELKKGTISQLQQIRRANAGIRSCIEILNEHSINNGSVPGEPCVWIRLDPDQEGGLFYAIEACSERISDIFDTDLEKLGVNWQDDFMPELSTEAKASAEMHRGDITYAEYEKRVNGEDPVQSAKNMIVRYKDTHTKEEFVALIECLETMHEDKKNKAAGKSH